MKKTTSSTSSAQPTTGFAKALDEILRRGARKMLMNAIEAEVASYIDSYATQLDENGKRLVVRNGYLPKRGPRSYPRSEFPRTVGDQYRLAQGGLEYGISAMAET